MGWTEDTEKFVQWMHTVGISLSAKVELKDYRTQNQGRGMVATEDIAEGEKLFSIPRSALITASSVPELKDLISDFEDWPQLMVVMMYVCQKHWKPYFDVLPTTFNTPMFWSQEQLDLLKGSAVVDKIGKEEATEMYKSLGDVLSNPIFEGIDVSEDAFHRMGSLIMAYGFDVVEEDETIKAMVPPADMLNSHSKLCNARLEIPDESDGPLDMIATKAIPKGSQVYNFYGDMPNSDLLRRYGYVEAQGNSSDVVEITLEALLAASGAKESVLDKWSEYDENEIMDEAFDIGYQGVPDPDLIAMANMLSQTPSKKAYRQSCEMAEEEELTDKAKEILIQAVTQRTGDYPAKLDELPESKEEVYTDVPTMCNQVLTTEKELLQMCLEWLGVSDNKRRKLE